MPRQTPGGDTAVTRRQEEVELNSTLCKLVKKKKNEKKKTKGTRAHLLFRRKTSFDFGSHHAVPINVKNVRKARCSRLLSPRRLQCVPAYLRRHQ